MRGSNASARANDSSCFCPTDSVAPRSATGCVVAARQPVDERVRVTRLARRSRTRSSLIAVVAQPDVARDRAGEEEDVLQHEAECARAARARSQLADVARRRAGSRPLRRRRSACSRLMIVVLPAPVAPTIADPLAGLDAERHVLQHPVARHLSYANQTSRRRSRRAASSRAAPLRGDELVHRRVEQPEDPLRRRHRALEHVELLRQVADRTEEALRVLEERHQRRRASACPAATQPPPYQMISAAASALTISMAGKKTA